MTPEEKSLLERTYTLSVENNLILRSMRRTARIAAVMRAIYWVVIIGLSIGAYYIIQPYVNMLIDSLMQLQGSVKSIQGIQNSSGSVDTILNAIKSLPR